MSDIADRPDISFVIISYNDAGRLPRAVSSAALKSAAAGWRPEIWVADNGSTDHTPRVLAALKEVLGDRLRVLDMGYNSGTTIARNRALEQAGGRLVCVMDSDAELLDDDLPAIDALLGDIPEIGILAPKIIMPDGSTYDSGKLLATLADKLWKLPGIFSRRPTVNHDWYPGFPFPRPRHVETAISCCWFFRRELFDLLGPLDENIFYSPEDLDWCLRCWRAGRAVVYYPHFKVLHNTRQISHKSPLSKTSISHFRGLLYYFAKHGYWFSRRGMERRYIEPLAARVDAALAAREDRP